MLLLNVRGWLGRMGKRRRPGDHEGEERPVLPFFIDGCWPVFPVIRENRQNSWDGLKWEGLGNVRMSPSCSVSDDILDPHTLTHLRPLFLLEISTWGHILEKFVTIRWLWWGVSEEKEELQSLSFGQKENGRNGRYKLKRNDYGFFFWTKREGEQKNRIHESPTLHPLIDSSIICWTFRAMDGRMDVSLLSSLTRVLVVMFLRPLWICLQSVRVAQDRRSEQENGSTWLQSVLCLNWKRHEMFRALFRVKKRRELESSAPPAASSSPSSFSDSSLRGNSESSLLSHPFILFSSSQFYPRDIEVLPSCACLKPITWRLLSSFRCNFSHSSLLSVGDPSELQKHYMRWKK